MKPIEIVTKKCTIALFAFIIIWNLSKFPYLLGFNHDGNRYYNSRGTEVSINLGHWLQGYRSNKLRCPPINFVLIHATLGLTLLAMMILSLVRESWRRRYCIPFFWFSILEGLHALPASAINDSGLAPLLLVSCALLIGTGVWGIVTKMNYDKDKRKADSNLYKQYIVITIINIGGAGIECRTIVAAFLKKHRFGMFIGEGEGPHLIVGTTFYDKFPEKIGVIVFFMFVTMVWFVWPLTLVELEKQESFRRLKQGNRSDEGYLLLSLGNE